MLILAASVLLRAIISSVIGAPIAIKTEVRDMAVCKLLGAEIVLSAPQDDVAWTCTSRYGT
jgi:hypothetical protein